MAKKKSLNPVVGIILFILFLIVGAVLGIVAKIYLFLETYSIPEKVSAIQEVSQGSLDVDVIKSEDLSIHFIELGNKYTGDCTLINVGDVEVLIDAGSRSSSVDDIYNYASTYVDGTLDYVVVTHAHQDHYAGFATENSLFNKFSVGTVIEFAQTNQKSDKGLYKTYLEEIAETEETNGTKVYDALECYENRGGASRVFDLGNNISLEILYHKFYEEKASSENDYSVCLMINQNDSNYYLFTGDLEEDGEESLVEEYYNEYGKNLPEMALYKAGHHGSKTSSSETLLEIIKPDVVCVCCCAGASEYTSKVENQFPTQVFINRIAKYTTQVYVTTMCLDYNNGSFQSFNGNIVVTSSNDDMLLAVAGANNSTVLKDTEWFKINRICPDEWKS